MGGEGLNFFVGVPKQIRQGAGDGVAAGGEGGGREGGGPSPC